MFVFILMNWLYYMFFFVGIKSHNATDKSSDKNLPVCNVPNWKNYHMYVIIYFRMHICYTNVFVNITTFIEYLHCEPFMCILVQSLVHTNVNSLKVLQQNMLMHHITLSVKSKQLNIIKQLVITFRSYLWLRLFSFRYA